jgi:hypothetical protein
MASAGVALIVAVVVVAGFAYSSYPQPGKDENSSVATSAVSSQPAATSPGGAAPDTTSSTSFASVNSTAASQVGAELSAWVSDLNDGCCYAIGYYSNSSRVEWEGNTSQGVPGFGGGTWTGSAGITSLFDEALDTLRPSTSLVVISDVTMEGVGGNVVASFDLVLNGSSTAYGAVRAAASVQQQWTPVGGGSTGWYIQDESWDFSSSYVQYSTPASQVSLQISDWARSIDNVCCNSSSYYTSSSEVKWYGINGTGSPLLNGTWTGSGGINEYFGQTLSWLMPSPSMVSVSDLVVKTVSIGVVNATFNLALNATNAQCGGAVKGNAHVQMEWALEGGTAWWHIRYESWDFTRSYVQDRCFIYSMLPTHPE